MSPMFDAARLPDLAPLREVLRSKGYTKAVLKDRIGRLGGLAAFGRILPLAPSGCEPDLDALIRVFALGRPAESAALSRILGTGLAGTLADAGLLTVEGGLVSSCALLVPIEEWYLASDFGPDLTGRPCAPDHVLGAGPAPLNLAGLTVRRRAASALDLGTGGGVQCLFMSSHAERITATDVNPRALSFAALNMNLNAVRGVELKPGSLYEPAGDETFDLIVSNPPFVIAPDRSSEFRSATDRESDSLSEAVVRGAGPRLKAGGYAVILLNWPHREAGGWAEAPLSWSESPGVSRWIMCFDTEEPAVYAARWIGDSGESLGRGEFEARFGEWMDYYRRRDIRWLSAGAVVLHRSAGGVAWTRVDRIERNVQKQGLCGGQVERICLAEDLLSQSPDADLLRMRFEPCPEHALVHEMKLSGGRWALDSTSLVLKSGFGFAGSADAGLVKVLELMDRGGTLGSCIDGFAGLIGADPAGMFEPVMDSVKKLLRNGHIRVRDSGAP